MIGLVLAQSALFLDMGAGPELGMGSVSAAVAQGVSAAFWNPAGLSLTDAHSLFFSHWEHFEGIRLEHFAWLAPTSAGSFAVSLGGLYTGGLERRTGPTPEPEGTFTYYDAFLGLSYARSFGEALSAGLSVKPIFSKIDDSQAFSAAFDAGTIYRFGSLSAGLALRNFGPGLKYEAKSTPLPSQVRLGLGFASPLARLGLDGAYFLYDGKLAFFGGLELTPVSALSLRLGYSGDLWGDWGDGSLEPGFLSGLTAGLEVRVGGLGIGYAFRNYENVGAAHRFYLVYSVSVPSEEAPKGYLIKARKTAESFYQEALLSYQKGELEDALVALDRALVWDPSLAEARALYEKIESELGERRVSVLVQQGIRLYKEGNYPEALAKLREALDLDSANAEARAWMDSVQLALEKEQEKYAAGVRKLLREGLELYSKGKLKQALSKFYGALAVDPGNSEAQRYVQMCQAAISNRVAGYLAKAEKAKSEGKLLTAKNYLKKALSLSPGDTAATKLLQELEPLIAQKAQVHMDRGRAYYRRGKFRDAEREFRLALKYDPSLSQARNYLNEIEAKRKAKPAKAEKKKPSPKEIEELYLKGVQAYVKGNYEEAIQYWEEVLKLDPNHEKAKLNIRRAKKKLAEQ